ncbi:MAG: DUF488 domain-containing protein [Acidobacteriota bacterium]
MHPASIYTIGHGRQPIEDFLSLLAANRIEVLADVRAVPRSRWPQFNQKALVVALGNAGIRYIHFPELGWKIQAPQADFEQGLVELVRIINSERVCMMCAESLPDQCHRHLVLTPPLLQQGIDVIHIYPNGQLKTLSS